MKTTKLSLANIQGKLSRTEMKSLIGGMAPGGGGGNQCNVYCNDNSVCDSKGGSCPNCDTDLPGVKGPNGEKGMCTY